VESTEIRKLVALEDRHWWYAERRRILASLLHTEIRQWGDLIALDIGAAGGGNTRVLRAAGAFAVPVEYGPEGAEAARDRGLPAVRGDAGGLPFTTAAAGLIVAFDILEHIEDDAAVLGEFARVLRPGGRLWVAVPCDMSLWSDHDRAVGHVRRYDRTELVEKVVAAGFEVQDVWSWNVLLRPVVNLRRRRAQGSDLGEIGRFTNWALARIIAMERYLPFVRRRSGVSLILIARRGGIDTTDQVGPNRDLVGDR
jgi:SAM-dependent methyltransferase